MRYLKTSKSCDERYFAQVFISFSSLTLFVVRNKNRYVEIFNNVKTKSFLFPFIETKTHVNIKRERGVLHRRTRIILELTRPQFATFHLRASIRASHKKSDFRQLHCPYSYSRSKTEAFMRKYLLSQRKVACNSRVGHEKKSSMECKDILNVHGNQNG